MKILITGVSGFLGSWAVHLLNELGHEIHGVSITNQSDYLWRKSNAMSKVVTYSDVDLTNFPAVVELVRVLAPDLIIHLAATSTLYESQKYPELAFKNNVLASASVLQACVQNSVPRVIVSTTDKVYHPTLAHSDEPFTEESTILGTEAYSISKACVENMVASISSMVGPHSKTLFTVVRMGNIIGGGDRGPWRLSTSIAHSITSGDPLLVRSPESTRPWQSVFDALTGLMVSGLSQSEVYESYNLAPQTDPLTVREILINLGTEAPYQVVEDFKRVILENDQLSISSEKIFSRTGFKTLLGPVEAFESLTRWERFAEVSSPQEVNLICEDQVKNYLSRFSSYHPDLFSLIQSETNLEN